MSLMDLFQNITKGKKTLIDFYFRFLICNFGNLDSGEYKKISKRYSEDMQDIIDKMIVVDPTNRIDTAYVL